ncbi:von Willebrand factor A domain-containing protein 7-like [Eucyclogobius newberryi]|uniref:von Willebrand factor A domain-containing protein 7-like n=1 Tax=Eucyclogobius newberryi TaxID=166745 RepID=UPI003B5AA2C7
MTPLLGLAVLAAALTGRALAFMSTGGWTSTHVSITETALLQAAMEACKAVLDNNGYEFRPTGNSPEQIVQACLGPTAKGDVSGAKFHSALQEIYMQNGLVDRDFVASAPHHFNSEAFLEGRSLITEGVAAIKANIRNENFQAARETLGRVLHTLQDFYSHSNWVELGYKEPYLNLIRPDLPIENIADVNTPTCRDCVSGICPNQILSDILQHGMLTSGYMGVYSKEKPHGKCSHGGWSDLTSFKVPRGGIHKDERRPDNQDYHDAAVKVATAATLKLLEDIRLAAGDNDFLRILGIARSSVVCFVIDTTGSMSDDIDEARTVIYEIIDEKKGTQDEPSEYILVPFNDPEVGPVIKTADPEVMKKEISKLGANGGGDAPEMCYSGIQLALTTAPSYSKIFVFTDAEAKDAHLQDTLDALRTRTKSEVNFFITDLRKRRRRSNGGGTFNDYRELALASGGQAIQVTKEELPQATDIILDTSTSALVTILQQARDPGKPETFSFSLDDSLKNITFYITGTSLSFTLTNPAGVTQSSSQASGSLATIKTVGNLWRSTLNADRATGRWQIRLTSSNAYTIKVSGQSTIAFIYDFVEQFEGPHPGYAVVTGRPQEGQPANLMLPVVGREGPDSLKITEVSLMSVTKPSIVSTNNFTDMGNGRILATVPVVPGGEFVVLLKGIDTVSNTEFQRQSTTQMAVSKVNIKATVSSSMEPGKAFTLPFGVFTNGAGGQYKINAQNDKAFIMSYPSSLSLTSGQYTNATLTITAPAGTVSGTDVTLTLDASLGSDSNYVVLRLSVLEKITDFNPPLCEIISIQKTCPQDVSECNSFVWELVANLTDSNGTGIENVYLERGNGTLTKVISDDPAQYQYNASCCSQVVEIVALDKIGNVGRCYHSIERSASASAEKLSILLMLSLLFSVFMVRPN